MVKQISLSDSKLINTYFYSVNPRVVIEGEVYDDLGEVISTSIMEILFEDLPPQVKSNLNNIQKHLSRVFNAAQANEDVETWEDI